MPTAPAGDDWLTISRRMPSPQTTLTDDVDVELVIEESTVKTHVGRVLTKLALRDRVQAVVLAYETGLVTTDQHGGQNARS
jgi:regulatory LuxR family protein